MRGDISGRNRPLRPPWALPEFQFTETCTRCGECIQRCPEKIIVEGNGRFPVVDFRLGECTFCEECVSCCEPGALLLDSENESAAPWELELILGHDCIAQKGVVCQICKDQCIESVFQFKPRVGGSFQMVLSSEDCTGCGACIAPCPVSALTLKSRSEQE